LNRLLNKPEDDGAWMTGQMRLMKSAFHAGDADLLRMVYYNLIQYYPEKLVMDDILIQFLQHQQQDNKA